MQPRLQIQPQDQDNTPGTMAEKNQALKEAATEWAGGFRQSIRGSMVNAGQQTETYVRNHPGRFIAGACCLGVAAGWLIGRAVAQHER